MVSKGLSNRKGHGARKPRAKVVAARVAKDTVTSAYDNAEAPVSIGREHYRSRTVVRRKSCFDAPVGGGSSAARQARCAVPEPIAWNDVVFQLKPRPMGQPERESVCKLDGAPLLSSTSEVRMLCLGERQKLR